MGLLPDRGAVGFDRGARVKEEGQDAADHGVVGRVKVEQGPGSVGEIVPGDAGRALVGEVAGEARVGECGADVVAAGEHVNAVAGGHTDRAHRSVLAKAPNTSGAVA
ncbi:hypothetical protein ACIQVO_09265 [Streptomyces sp. NPDC101062]|uniref:hypothetical protein n=1 Tax=unclassified Streptomyces TaxID=2593676 RepID=UPI00380502C0